MLEQSLRILGLEQIDFYNCWCIKTMEEYSAYMKKGGIYEAMMQAKGGGPDPPQLLYHPLKRRGYRQGGGGRGL